MNEEERKWDRYYDSLLERENYYTDDDLVDEEKLELENKVQKLADTLSDIVWLVQNDRLDEAKNYIEERNL